MNRRKPIPATRPGARTASRGFTLVELLISVAIFVTVIASVTLLFNAAIRASKQGFQNQEAFEIARGAMDIIERDLSRSVTRTDLGDVFNFYGTPIGFTFVGMIPEGNSNRLNMARVTYVIYHDPDNAADQEFNAVTAFRNTEDEIVPTYALIRFVETGVSDLDSYPVDWSEPAAPEGTGPPFQTIIENRVQELAANGACNEFDPLVFREDVTCRERLEGALKRQVWIVMLSGGGAVPQLEMDVPNAWDEPQLFPGQNILGEPEADPLDFAIAENISHLGFFPTRGGDSIDNDGDDLVDEPDEALVALGCFPGLDVLDCTQNLNTEPPEFNPFAQGRIPFFSYTTYVETFEPQTQRTIVAPATLRYWNDVAGVFSDGLDNDDDDTTGDSEEVNLGSPLEAVIPASVNVDFRLFFPSPFPGAPDFNEQFTQRIDLLTGYRRATPEIPAGS